MAQETTQQVQQRQAASYKKAIEDYSVEKAGAGLDYASIVLEGEKLLTKGELLDLSDAKDDFGEQLYKKSLNALLRKGGDRAEELQKLIDARKQKPKSEEEEKKPKETTPKKKKKKHKSEEDELDEQLLEDSDEEEGDKIPETPSKRITKFMFG